jgi:hypothetical protein
MQKIIGLITVLATLGAMAIFSSVAVAEEAAVVVEPVNTAEMAPMSLSQCSQGTVCAWSTDNFEGNFSWWPGTPTGCKTHENNPKLRSGWNRTQHFVWYGTVGVPPGEGWTLNPGANPITGQVCW